MKHIRLVCAFLICSPVYAGGSAPHIEVRHAIKVNGGTSASTFDVQTDRNIVVGLSGANNINSFQTAIQFVCKDGETAVNVQNFKVTRGDFTLVRNGLTVWDKTPFGSYHPISEGNPDYLVYTTSAEVTPTGPNKWVSDLNGDGLGTIIPNLSKFQLVNHVVSLGSIPRPKLATPGDYYTLWYDMTITYIYNGTPYTRVFVPSETAVQIMVIADIPGFVNVGGGPSRIDLEISDNLQNWQIAPIPVPHPRPAVVPNIIALVPRTTAVNGLVNSRRFYRFTQTEINPPLP
jgi:hypothetical protein